MHSRNISSLLLLGDTKTSCGQLDTGSQVQVWWLLGPECLCLPLNLYVEALIPNAVVL